MCRVIFIIACQLIVWSSVFAGPKAVCEATERFYITFNGSLPKNFIVIQDYNAKSVRRDLEALNGAQRVLPAIWNIGFETMGIDKYAIQNQKFRESSLEQLDTIEQKIESILQRLPIESINISQVDLKSKAVDVLEQTKKYRRELNERGFVTDENANKG